jgi:hypothetical protein
LREGIDFFYQFAIIAAEVFYMEEDNDYRRQRIIREAKEAADRIILDGSEGSVEETNYLTARVAEEMVKTALGPFYAAILKKDMDDHNSGNGS